MSNSEQHILSHWEIPACGIVLSMLPPHQNIPQKARIFWSYLVVSPTSNGRVSVHVLRNHFREGEVRTMFILITQEGLVQNSVKVDHVISACSLYSIRMVGPE